MIDYLKYCSELQIVPFPVMSYVQNGVLALEGVKLSAEVATALGKFLPV